MSESESWTLVSNGEKVSNTRSASDKCIFLGQFRKRLNVYSLSDLQNLVT